MNEEPGAKFQNKRSLNDFSAADEAHFALKNVRRKILAPIRPQSVQSNPTVVSKVQSNRNL